MKAVVLLSGGLDSAVAAQLCGAEELYAISVDYGQRHAVELEAARRVGAWLDVVDHQFVRVTAPWADSGVLSGDLDRGREPDAMAAPKAYLPARNVVLLSYALAYAESVGAREIVVGFNADDREGYPDCRPDFRHAWADMAHEAVGHNIWLQAPLQDMTKKDIVDLGDPELMALTWSCYDPQPVSEFVSAVVPCNLCDACVLRNRAFGV